MEKAINKRIDDLAAELEIDEDEDGDELARLVNHHSDGSVAEEVITRRDLRKRKQQEKDNSIFITVHD